VLSSKKVFFGPSLARRLLPVDLTQIAGSAQRFVEMCPTNDNLLVMGAMPTVREQSRGPISTAAAQRRDTLHTVCKRNAFEELTKRTAVEVPVQSHEEEALVVPFNHALNERN
jgi:hypothetical protein